MYYLTVALQAVVVAAQCNAMSAHCTFPVCAHACVDITGITAAFYRRSNYYD